MPSCPLTSPLAPPLSYLPAGPHPKYDTPRTPPLPLPPNTLPLFQNVWRNPSLQGQWAKGGGGTLATEERALLDAYGASKGGKKK